MNRPKQAVGYVRISSADDSSTSPKTQADRIAAHCRGQGWELVEIVEDIGVSGSARGKRLDRPGLQKIKEMRGNVDVIVALRLDRLARNVKDLLTLIEEAEEHGASVATVEGSIDTGSANGRLIITILAAVAELEAAQIRERTLAGREEAIRQGRWVGGPSIYGTRAVPREGGGKILALDPVEAPILREMMAAYLSGKGAHTIARELNGRGLRSRTGIEWQPRVVAQILESHAQDSIVLTAPERHALADAMESRKLAKDRAPSGGGSSLLSPVLKCATCLGTMYQTVPRPGLRPVYRCDTRSGESPRLHGRAMAEEADAVVTEHFLDTFGDHKPGVRTVPAEEYDYAVASARDAVTERHDALVSAADREARQEAMMALNDAEDALQRLLDSPPSRTIIYKPGTVTLREKWEAADPLDRRQLLRDYVGVVLCSPARGDDGKITPTADRLRFPDPDDVEAAARASIRADRQTVKRL